MRSILIHKYHYYIYIYTETQGCVVHIPITIKETQNKYIYT